MEGSDITVGSGGALTRDQDGIWQRRRLVDVFMTVLITVSALIGVAVLLAILAYVVINGAPALNLDFFTQRPLPYGEVGGGVAPAILGTLYMLFVAGLIGVPIGVGTGIYLSEYAGTRLAPAVRFTIDLIAGLPSIVIGVFVWALLVRHLVGHFSGLAGSVALAIVMVPIITRTVEEVLRLVPGSLREAALALGVPRWRTILRVVLPTARSGVTTGVVLAMARAGGETAPLLLTSLGNQFFNTNLLQPMAALPVQIYNYASSPFADWHTKAWGGALVLIATIGVLSLVTRLATRGQRPG
ncbi:MAG: phosphate ABC transporter permease PstA [Chloroflexi bacterium]|nr:phosphate ABC transporter permease PstA [Chloroflexota bacterium]MCL5107956.1 phosphate ABC transporter permease PstA [Chloroflexota bacterium]